MKVTLKDLAKEFGCSVTTISRALKDNNTISLELRRKVKARAEELGYIPNIVAGSMRTGQTKTIAVILQDLRNPFFSILGKYIEEFASNQGYSIFFMTTSELIDREIEAVNTAIGKNVDGILLLPNQKDARSVEILKRYKIPHVLVGRYFSNLDTDYVIANDQKGSYLVTKHLIERGYQRILFLNSFMYISSSYLRLEGFKQAYSEASLPFNKNDVITVSTDRGEACGVIKNIFNKKHDYNAVFTYCDVIAFETVFTLNELGYHVGKDIAVAGVDDIHSDVILPVKITSASYSRKEMAYEAVNLLIKRINEGINNVRSDSYEHHVIDITLSMGQTT
ncbi:MAG TPA: LacI family transcriptional regulator [Firmicutes bacterium]|jgi:LacI family transcriptional regulator|nr:LacI family transcriptional regulator [Bacillota bacterium]